MSHTLRIVRTVDDEERRARGREATRRHRERKKLLGGPACSVEGCGRVATTRGWCDMHYLRWLKLGDVGEASPRFRQGMRPYERLMDRVEVDPGGCWVWTGSVNGEGYGTIGVGRRSVLTHRFAYEHHHGPIPGGMTLDHLCRVRVCCNPLHLEAVTHQENVRRAVATRTTCGKGHPRTQEHGKPRPSDGVWVCKTCIDLRIKKAS